MTENKFEQAVALTNNGKTEEAIKLCSEILTANPDHLDAIQMKAIHVFRLGDQDVAIALLKTAAEKHPDNFNLQLNLGELYRLKNEWQNAEHHFTKTIAINPDFPMAYYNKGKLKLQQQQGYEAAQLFQKVLTIEANNASAHFQLANAYLMINERSSAIASYEKAMAINPHDIQLLMTLVEVQKKAKNYPAAITALDLYLNRNPQSEKAWLEKGQLHQKLNQIKPAFEALDKARKSNPENPKTLLRFAEVLSDIGKVSDALTAYQRALKLSPEDPEILNNYGGLLLENKQYEEAITWLKKSAQINPNNHSASVNMGLAYESIGKISSAKEVYDRIKHKLADNDLFRLHIETMCPGIAHSNEETDKYRKAVVAVLQKFDEQFPIQLNEPQLDKSYAVPSFNMTYQGKNDREIKSLWGKFYEKRIPPVVLGSKNQKPKIGFLVTHSHEGVFIKDTGGIIKNLDTDKFDLVVLANGTDSLDTIKHFVLREEVTYVSFSRILKVAVEEIASLNMDFLYYWEVGSDLLNYLLPFYQLARIQISSWGSAFTSGNPRIQHYWSSKWLENKDYKTHYSEDVILFDNLPTYYYRIKKPDEIKTRKDFDLPTDKKIYLCAQSMIKAHPDFDELIKGILERDDHALVYFLSPKKQDQQKSLVRRFQSSLPAYLAKIKFLSRVGHQDYLALMALADVCIDPPHYSGANTTYEALQVGTPVVSLPGQLQRGKYTEALYKILELEKFIPKTKQEYVDLAVKIANDQSLKEKITNKVDKNMGRLFEQKGIIDEIEAFLIEKFNG